MYIRLYGRESTNVLDIRTYNEDMITHYMEIYYNELLFWSIFIIYTLIIFLIYKIAKRLTKI